MYGNSHTKRYGKNIYHALLFLIFICLSAALLLSPGVSEAARVPLLENAGACLVCHYSKDMKLVFTDKDKMPVTVSERDFAQTVHSKLNCADCHQGASPEKHPGKAVASRAAFRKEASGVCRTCHSDAQLRAKPNHAYMIDKADAPLCTECHGGHKVLSIRQWKAGLQGTAYCLVCHRQNISKSLGPDERLSLSIDPADQASSVHNKHACSDCHTEYTREIHPLKTFSSPREHSIAVSGVCAKCHEEKQAALRGSMHYNLSFRAGEALISRGNPKAPVCTDCHGFHTVGPKKTYETLSGTPCRKCHEGIFAIYAKSVHGMAKARGEHQAPLCASCHFAHEVNFTAMSDKIKGACLGCHKGVEELHKKWLPNTELHLSAIACASCHAPSSEKGIYLQFVDQRTGKSLPQEQILQLLGTTSPELSERLDTHGQGLSSYELSYILKQLNKKGVGSQVAYLGKMDVVKYSEAHQLSLKKNAIRECETCHSSDSKFLKKVTLAVLRTDGSMDRYPARPDVLTSIFSTLSSGQFYMVGGTRMTLLDWAGIIVVCGGLLFPVLHITARVLTAPLRRAGRSEDPAKGDKS
ncbi:MAG: hypothetical protein EPN25_01675 [Nitrospirae bacterium]|nr:MAG: hypothetical protein EPN25_01675 [Nitrospirota bacterium]